MNFQKIKSKKKILKKNSALGALISSFGFGLREKTSPASDSTSKGLGSFSSQNLGYPNDSLPTFGLTPTLVKEGYPSLKLTKIAP